MKKLTTKLYKNASIEWMDLLILLPFLPVIAFTLKYKIIFIPFAIILGKNLVKFFKKQCSLEKVFISAALYGLILSDNMVIIALVGLFALFYFVKGIKEKTFHFKKANLKIYCITAIFIVYVIINIVVNKVPLPNVILYFMFSFAFIVMIYIFSFKLISEEAYFDNIFNTIILAQAIYTIIFIPFNLAFVKANLIGDWSVGTLGISQGPILFNLFVFGFIKFFAKFRYTGEKKLVLWMLLCFFGAISTVTVSMTILFIGVFFVYIVLFVSKPKLKIGFIIMTLILAVSFWTTSDSWIKDDLTKIVMNKEARNNRVKKLATYDSTFLIIPKTDKVYALIGEGIGNYSSRGALTASGYYTSWYNKDRFPVYTSNYSRKYIKPRNYSRFGLSVIQLPTSEYISFMGEFGYIGFVAIMLMFLVWFIKSKGDNKLLLAYILTIMALDNYLEYPKIAVAFWAVYIVINSYHKNYKRVS
jgi:hypothetical protein